MPGVSKTVIEQVRFLNDKDPDDSSNHIETG